MSARKLQCGGSTLVMPPRLTVRAVSPRLVPWPYSAFCLPLKLTMFDSRMIRRLYYLCADHDEARDDLYAALVIK